MTPWNLLALPPLPEDLVRAILAPLGDRVEVRVPAARDRGSLLDGLAEAEIVLGDWSAELALDAEAVAAAPRLAFVQQPAVGVEGYDLDALAAAGVPLANAAGVNATSVAEWCLAAALSLARKLGEADAAVRAGEWPQQQLRPRELAGSRVGIVGFGPIGVICKRLFEAFGCQVAYWTRTPREEPGYTALDGVIADSDVLVVVIALSEETRGMIDAGRMKEGALLINAARGGVVNQAALAAAIESGHLGGAALDVFDAEPLPVDDPLRKLDRVLLSPHVAGVTPASTGRLLTATMANLTAALEGRPVEHVVNGVSQVITRKFGGSPSA
ncbi:NAD(P)-dependent oxidoreductase [Nonomuraea sp. NPDC050536]|uniref:NAD(P)-dependent oxidoreductase n=1 Tax=Nonomuraea sp. NPDC050536 TaxID=3364366 RepID=UPI0037CCB53F